METAKRRKERYASEGIVTYIVHDEKIDHKTLVQVVNKSTDGLGVVYAGKNPPELGDKVKLSIEENTDPVEAILKWRNEVFKDVYILGFSLGGE